MISGSFLANALQLTQLRIDLRERFDLKAVCRLVNTESKKVHGFVDNSGMKWSEKTVAAAKALQEAIEEDVAAAHFAGASRNTRTVLTGETGVQMPGVPEGLGEFVAGSEEGVQPL